jgi:proteasome lid subunit RPN8/RPN11
MLAQAAAERPLECCGLLAGPANDGPFWRVVRYYPLVNAAASPTEYESEARSILAADKDMRRNGWKVLAIYHSHPTSPPVPSRKDLENNFYGDTAVHLIISLQSAQPKVHGWWLSATEYREAEWEVVDD